MTHTVVGPERNPKLVEIAGRTVELLPTPFLRLSGGVLEQWFETSVADVEMFRSKGEWHPVPTRGA